MPLSHEVERNIIIDFSSTAASIKSKLESGDTPTRRVWLSEDPHSSVVGVVYVHVLRTLVPSDYHSFSLMSHAPSMEYFNNYGDVEKWLDDWTNLKDNPFF